MRNQKLRVAMMGGALALALAGASNADAQDTASAAALRLSGFGTLGASYLEASEPWGFRREVTQANNTGGWRLDTDSRLGLQANYTVNSSLEFVGQAILERRVASAPPIQSLEWAFMSIRPAEDWTIRVGRYSPDIYLISDYRNVGFAYPWVRPNVEMYSLLAVNSLDGADVEKAWKAGDARLRAKLLGGTGHEHAPGGQGQPDSQVSITPVFAGVVSAEVAGLLLRATLAHARVSLGPMPGKDLLRQGLAQASFLPIRQIASQARSLSAGLDPDSGSTTYFALGASYEAGDWFASGEAAQINSALSYAAVHTAYLSLGRHIQDMTLFAMAGLARSRHTPPGAPQWVAQLTPVVGPSIAQQLQALGTAAADSVDSTVDQRSLSLGSRYDLNAQVDLKFQWDHFWVGANGSSEWGVRTFDPGHADLLSITMDFVF
jgi:hypothetical protein